MKSKRKASVAPASSSADPASSWRQAWGAIAVVVLVAGVLRVWAAQDPLWFDEVWSLWFSGRVDSPWGIFTLHHDNNHYLNTLWMYLWGVQRHWFIYRVPAVVSGVATVWLAACIARRWGGWQSLIAAVLTGGSYVLITYASEARGYALGGCFALAAFLLLDRYLHRRDVLSNVGFCLVCVLGFLSHLTFVIFYGGAIAWTLTTLWMRETSWRSFVVQLARCHLLPLSVLAAIYWFDVRLLQIGGLGGENHYRVSDVLVQAMSLSVGGTGMFGIDVVLSVLVLLATAWGIARLWREDPGLAVFFAVTSFAVPLVVFSLHRPEHMWMRYFYFNILFFLILLSYVLGLVRDRGQAGRVMALAAVLLITAANLRWTVELLQVGRGDFLGALRYLAQRTPGPDLDLQSDRDLECQLQLAYLAQFLPPGKHIHYHPQSEVMTRGPEWVILHSQDLPYRPAGAVTDWRPSKDVYELERVFPFTGLSGYHWAVYRRADLRRH